MRVSLKENLDLQPPGLKVSTISEERILAGETGNNGNNLSKGMQ